MDSRHDNGGQGRSLRPIRGNQTRPYEQTPIIGNLYLRSICYSKAVESHRSVRWVLLDVL